MVGIDTASIEYAQSVEYGSHRTLYQANIPGLENVAHMDKLPAKGFTVYAAPMFITGGSGGPCRIFARLDEDDNKDCTKSVGASFHSMFMIFGITFYLLFRFL